MFPSSAVWVVLILRQAGWAGRTSCNARLIPSASASSSIISLPPSSMATSAHSTATNGKEKSTFSRVASPASLFPPLDEDEERKTTVSSGLRCYELYERLSQHGLSLRTCVASLLSTTAWYSSACALNWKRMATKSSRFVFQLAPSARRTGGSDCGLLPTTRANKMLLGTPTSRDWRDTGNMENVPVNGLLGRQIAMLPTPSASISNDGESIESWERRKQKNLAKNNNGNGMGTPLTIAVGKSTGLKLQPAFAAWMMNFPGDWTLRPFLKRNGGEKASKPTEMPSFLP